MTSLDILPTLRDRDSYWADLLLTHRPPPQMVSALLPPTQYRLDVLSERAIVVIREAMQKVCDDFGAKLVELNGEDDHVRKRPTRTLLTIKT